MVHRARAEAPAARVVVVEPTAGVVAEEAAVGVEETKKPVAGTEVFATGKKLRADPKLATA